MFKIKHLLKSPQSYLSVGFILIIALMIVTNIFTVSQMKSGNRLMNNTLEQQQHNHELLETMYMASVKRSYLFYKMMIADDVFEVDELYMELNELASIFTHAREHFQELEHQPELMRLFSEQTKLIRLNVPLQLKAVEHLMQEEKEQALKLLSEEILPRQDAILQLSDKMGAFQNNLAQQAFRSNKLANSKVFAITILFAISSIILSILLSFYIVNKQRQNEHKLAYMASTDVLTELPNRANFIKSIEESIKNKPASRFAIIFFDIDYFKSINDNYGHEVGDEILRQFSSLILGSIKEVDVLSRFGGDEFVLLLRSIRSASEANEFINKLSSKLDTSFVINGKEVFISSSIGASIYPLQGRDAKTLLKHSDMAMYCAKESGRNCVQFFSNKISEKMNKDHALSHALHTVIKNNNLHNELVLNYQPQLDIDNGGFTECEALLGWTNKEGEVIPADEFIPLAERSNLIEKINIFVINSACHQQMEWQKSNFKNMRININLSGNKSIFEKLLRQFQFNLKEMKLSPSLFGIELTERTLNEISSSTIKELEEMRSLGVKISIDDFGKDYSSLSYLKKLPITTLKIDKEFISGLPDDKDDQALVKTIITLGHALDLDVVAEGVETREQFEFLKKHSCNSAQGYYFHHPLNCKEISQLDDVA